MTSQGWVFTINNPKGFPEFNKKTMKFLGHQTQMGEETKTRHLQGYVQFKCNQIRSRVVDALAAGGPAHVEAQRGTVKQCIDYYEESLTNMDATAVAHGAPDWDYMPAKRKQGTRTELLSFREDAQRLSRKELRAEYPEIWAKFPKWATEELMLANTGELQEIEFPVALPWGMIIPEPSAHNKMRHWWIWGPPDCGKTRGIDKAFGRKNVLYICAGGKHSYEHYDGQRIIIYDDVLPTTEELLSITNTLSLPMTVPGATRYHAVYRPFNVAVTVIVLANKSLSEYPAAIKARFNEHQVHVGGRAAAAPAAPVEEVKAGDEFIFGRTAEGVEEERKVEWHVPGEETACALMSPPPLELPEPWGGLVSPGGAKERIDLTGD